MAGRNILVLTSTVAPQPGAHALRHCDPKERLADYLRSLDFYLPLISSGVFDEAVYIDNSGYPLEALERKASDAEAAERVEFVSFVSDMPPLFSRYYLEANLLIEGFKRSRRLAGVEGDVLWKVTGRYIVSNIDRIVASQPAHFDLYLNLRNLPYKVVDFYLVGARGKALTTLLERNLHHFRNRDDGEILLRRRMDEGAYADFEIAPRMRVTPRLSGVRGFDGVAYDSPVQTLKHQVRARMNHLAPWLWI